MKNIKALLIGGNLVLLMSYIGFSSFQKEQILNNGDLILLELEPVDPRSLMQGDYMNLRYEIVSEEEQPVTEEANNEEDPIEKDSKGIIDKNKYLRPNTKTGYCIVKKQKDDTAYLVRFQKEVYPLNHGEYAIKYNKLNSWEISIGASSYFFQEGNGERFNKAKYGGLKVDKSGHSLLVGLYDKERKLIQ